MHEYQRRNLRWKLTAASFAVLIACIFPVNAAALPINVDFGASFGTPSNSYGAAAGWVGFWNQIDPTSSAPNAVLDLNGNPTGVTVTVSVGEGLFFSNDPTTAGDDQALLDDELDVMPWAVGGSATVTISGLRAGEHKVYTYARDADTPTNETVTITVNGSSVLVSPASDIFSGFVEGETHAVHTLTLAAGQDLVITSTIVADVPGDYGMINGIQFTPEPETLLLVGAGLVGLAIQGRRRSTSP